MLKRFTPTTMDFPFAPEESDVVEPQPPNVKSAAANTAMTPNTKNFPFHINLML